jgi:outer membrane immunogenic protein
MKNILVCFLTFVVIGSGVSAAFADTYISGNLGAVILNDSDINGGPVDGKFTFDVGPGFLIAIGSSVETGGRMSTQNAGPTSDKDHARLELELGYRKNDIDKIKINGFGSDNADGDFSSISLMGNLLYDFSMQSGFTPYIGLGAGVANVKVDSDDANSENDTVAAGQFIFGASYDASESLKVDIQYRYFATDNPEFDDGVDAEYRTNNLMIGLRHTF